MSSDDQLPAGAVTLGFTDIEGSSELAEQHDAAFAAACQEHFRVLRACLQRWRGVEVKTIGDALFAAFPDAADAVQWAVACQLALSQHRWPEELGTIRIRIGMHRGEPIIWEDAGRQDYHGSVPNRTARVTAAAHGGQTLVSNAVKTAIKDLPAESTWLDGGVHRLRGVGEEHLWQLCHPGLPVQFPPLHTLDAQKHNLPLANSPFIGREQQVLEWSEHLLDPGTRLLTLTGFGGIGKTRLALQLADLCIGDFPDGVWWVHLDTASSGDEMIQRIAHALRLHLEPNLTVTDQLVNYLRAHSLLLLLDECEQIPDAADVVAELLELAPGLTMLATSRRALRLQCEHVREVPPMSANESEQLLVERAIAHGADLNAFREVRADMAELCHRLDNVPLAIELAASRLRMMSPRDALERLDQRFRLLRSTTAGLPSRQQALETTIDWSYDLLTAEHQQLFSQLAAFAGGFTLSAAEAICGGCDVWEGIGELVNQSLVCRDPAVALRQARFTMLESVAHYARGKLQCLPEAEQHATRSRHLDHFLAFAREQEAQRRTPLEVESLIRLESEFGNLRTAMRWAEEHSGEDAGMRHACASLGLALGWALGLRGLWCAALRFVTRAAQCLGSGETGGHAELLAEVKVAQAGLHHDLGESEIARALVGEGLTMSRATGNDVCEARALNLLGLLDLRDGRLAEAEASVGESLSIRRRLMDRAGMAVCLDNLGLLAMQKGEAVQAERYF